MSRFWLRGLAALVVLSALAVGGAEIRRAAAQAAVATPPPAPMIVMVDMQQLIYGSKAGKGVQAQMDKQRQAFSKEVAQQEDQLHKSQAEFERQRSVLAPDALEAKNRELQQRLEELDRFVKGKQQAWQQSYNEAMSKVEDEGLRVVAEIAAERSANLVIQKAAVIFGKDGFDVTPDAMARLDQRLPAVTVNPPKEGESDKAKAAGPPPALPPKSQ